jgi:hypothetical protein
MFVNVRATKKVNEKELTSGTNTSKTPIANSIPNARGNTDPTR